jgi:type I restriction enzyme S subunit
MKWPVAKLHDVCRPKQWPTISMKDLKEEGFPVYGANGRIGYYDKFTHEYPTLLITCRGATCGTINICESRSYVTGNSMALDNLDEVRVVQQFLFYFLRQRRLDDVISGSAQPQITREGLKNVEIPLPPLAEQRRIAEVLGRAEALRTKRRVALAQLDILIQAIFLDLFGDPTTILAKWPTKKLGEMLDFLTSGSRGWATHYTDSGDLFLRIQNVRHDELLLDDVAYVKVPKTAEARRTHVEPGDVLLSITADLGRTAVVPEGIRNAFINQHLSILRTKAMVPRFLSAYFASPVGQRQVSGRNKHAVKAGLNFDDIRSFIVPLPPLSLQREFARRVAAVDKLKTAHRASLAEMDALFASLQHRAFRGEL